MHKSFAPKVRRESVGAMSLRPAAAARTDASLALATPSSRIDTVLRIGKLHLESSTALTYHQRLYLRLKYPKHKNGNKQWSDLANAQQLRDDVKDLTKKGKLFEEIARLENEAKAEEDEAKEAERKKEARQRAFNNARQRSPAPPSQSEPQGKAKMPSAAHSTLAAKSSTKTYYLLCLGFDDYTTMRKKVDKEYFMVITEPGALKDAWRAYNNSRVEVHDADKDRKLAALVQNKWDVNPGTDEQPHVFANRHYGKDEHSMDRIVVAPGYVTEHVYEPFGDAKANAAIMKIIDEFRDNWGSKVIAIDWDIWKHVNGENRKAFLDATEATEIHLIINDFMSFGDNVDLKD